MRGAGAGESVRMAAMALGTGNYRKLCHGRMSWNHATVAAAGRHATATIIERVIRHTFNHGGVGSSAPFANRLKRKAAVASFQFMQERDKKFAASCAEGDAPEPLRRHSH